MHVLLYTHAHVTRACVAYDTCICMCTRVHMITYSHEGLMLSRMDKREAEADIKSTPA